MHGCDRRAFQNALPQSFRILPVKRLSLCHHFIKHGAQAEQIGSCVGRLAPNLLRRHVVQHRRNFAFQVLKKIPYAGNAVAQNLDRSIPAAHDLGRLQAVVHNVVRFRVLQPSR